MWVCYTDTFNLCVVYVRTLYELVLFFYHSGDGAEVFRLGSKLL